MSEKKINWYENIEELYSDYRKMNTIQLEKKYNISVTSIKNELKRYKFNVSKKYINQTLSDNEIIFMYVSLLNEDVKSFSNGLFQNENKEKYAIIIFNYLFKDYLKWKREDICNNISSSIFDKYKVTALFNSLNLKIYEMIDIIYPEYNIMPWEFKKSSCGNGYWQDNIHIDEAILWLKNKLSNEKGIISINHCGRYGFDNILDEYGLISMRMQCFNSSIYIFERMYNCKYNKEDMLKENYTFKICTNYNIHNKEGILYQINSEYYKLSDVQKTLANEIIKFCEQENRYPSEKDLVNKNGYISWSQFDKYFKGFTNATKYIQEINNTKGCKGNIYSIKQNPATYKCKKCKIKKPFTNEFFNTSTGGKFGLSYICKDCGNIQSLTQSYQKKNLNLNFNKDNVPKWWEKLYNKEIKVMPRYCYKDENIIIIIRYVVMEIVKLDTKERIIEWFKGDNLKKYKIKDMVYKLGNTLATLQKCFPQYEFSEDDFKQYNNEILVDIIDEFIKNNNITIKDILQGKTKTQENKKMSALLAYYRQHENIGINNIFVLYFKIKNIKHPIYNREICEYDFSIKPNGYFENENSRINVVKYYCEQCCEENILDCINDTEKLKAWIYKYFTQKDVSKVIAYNRYYDSLYDLLTNTYPIIKEKHILFKWEWTQCNQSDSEFLIKMLREYVLYRMNDIISNLETDIPTYVNRSYFDVVFPKMNKHINKKRFKNYYEWAKLAFPEYSNKWTPEEFNIVVSFDGIEFDSCQERDIYEFIKKTSEFKYIKSIGRLRSGKYIFKFDGDNYSSFCPDFVVEDIFINNKKYKLQKPIIIEYYGMYEENHKNEAFIKYKKKTIYKEEFYKNNNDILYIGIYPNDIKNNYKGLVEKLDLFILQQININDLFCA